MLVSSLDGSLGSGRIVSALKKDTGLSDIQLDATITEDDILPLAKLFDSYKPYLDKLGLPPAECVEIENTESVHTAMKEALTMRLKLYPATSFRDILRIVAHLNEKDVAMKVCRYIADSHEGMCIYVNCIISTSTLYCCYGSSCVCMCIYTQSGNYCMVGNNYF